jgi:pimeloyl-ACP methyl ester carboxylesterase
MVDDAGFSVFWSRYLRSGASPTAARVLGEMNTQVDVRDIVADIEVPTLIMHRIGDRDVPVEGSRWLAGHITDARLVEFDGRDHLPQIDSEEIMGAIGQFLAGLSIER